MHSNIQKFIIINILLLILSVFNIYLINNLTINNIRSYTISLAKKITRYLVNSVYIDGNLQNEEDIYKIIKGKDDEIKTIEYNAKEVNKMLENITNRIHEQFLSLETEKIKSININEQIITNRNKKNNYNNGIVLEVPSFIMSKNYLLNNLGPTIPVKISLTGGFDSYVSTDVKEYGLNNAIVTVYLNIKVTEQITMPFLEDEIVIDNKIPVAISLINGKIPEYYLNGLTNNSNLYKNE